MKKRTTPSLESKRAVVMEPKEKSVSNDYVVSTDRRWNDWSWNCFLAHIYQRVFLIRVPFFAGVHFNAATLHRQQRETAKAKGEVTGKKECVLRRTGEEKCEAITETERRTKKDLPHDGASGETEEEDLICRQNVSVILWLGFVVMFVVLRGYRLNIFPASRDLSLQERNYRKEWDLCRPPKSSFVLAPTTFVSETYWFSKLVFV